MSLTGFHLCCQAAKISPKNKEMLATRFICLWIEYLTVEEGTHTHTHTHTEEHLQQCSVCDPALAIWDKVPQSNPVNPLEGSWDPEKIAQLFQSHGGGGLRRI
jgi:hypothetical protein